IKNGDRIMTHCNAGALATVDWGTALAPIREAWRNGKDIFVYVSETRPRLQGMKLTAFELLNEGIPHAIIPDGASGHFMREGVDMVIVGADRIAANGDFANKIGTYEKAVLAKELGVPFYTAAPLSTFDLSIKKGEDIPIEYRGEEEVTMVDGVRIAPEGCKALNPGFDVTPARYLTGIITEMGVIHPEDVAMKLKEARL
ncbi:MAG: S-methyl-5-thioribose-1-phosphate isomerase, partial [Methanomassiliicoccales archaeon]|nr:S-methyl-5-thioribose-1-phosphate isomerase [Methanomassiliicoccales archaeon]